MYVHTHVKYMLIPISLYANKALNQYIQFTIIVRGKPYIDQTLDG